MEGVAEKMSAVWLRESSEKAVEDLLDAAVAVNTLCQKAEKLYADLLESRRLTEELRAENAELGSVVSALKSGGDRPCRFHESQIHLWKQRSLTLESEKDALLASNKYLADQAASLVERNRELQVEAGSLTKQRNDALEEARGWLSGFYKLVNSRAAGIKKLKDLVSLLRSQLRVAEEELASIRHKSGKDQQ